MVVVNLAAGMAHLADWRSLTPRIDRRTTRTLLGGRTTSEQEGRPLLANWQLGLRKSLICWLPEWKTQRSEDVVAIVSEHFDLHVTNPPGSDNF